MLAWLPNRQKVLSSLDRTSPTSHKLQLAYCLAHWILLRLWTFISHQRLLVCLAALLPNCALLPPQQLFHERFQDDKGSCLRAKLVTKWKSQNNIRKLDWPTPIPGSESV